MIGHDFSGVYLPVGRWLGGDGGKVSIYLGKEITLSTYPWVPRK